MAEKPEYRIFIDSNVLISGIYSSKGAPARILNLHASGKITIVLSQLILREVVLTLEKKMHQALPALNTFLTNAVPEIVKDASLDQVTKWSHSLHFEDAAIFAAAINSQPDYFVTADKHLYSTESLAEKSGLTVVTPAQLIKLLDI
jgi:putative PIN family toxin of toxin-antitoxin system